MLLRPLHGLCCALATSLLLGLGGGSEQSPVPALPEQRLIQDPAMTLRRSH